MGIVIQVRKYPNEKGSKSRSIIIQEDDVEKVTLNVKKLYDELKVNPEATITFYR